MEKIKQLFVKYRELISYVFFGGVTTLVNIVSYNVLAAAGLSTGVANGIAWVLSVLTAYFTNRIWVFHSRSTGAAALKEFASFVGCRLGSGLLDEGIMIFGVDWLGPRIAPGHLRLWALGVKVFSNILVMILNYVFSKLFIFKKKEK